MKEYYDILDVSTTATPEEIKAQYRQMVRIYHPDRFRNQDDKAYAEEKLKEINIAFQVLSGTSVRQGSFEARVAPQPVAYPPYLDFGTLQIGQRAIRNVQIGNLGGPVESVQFGYSNEKPCFQFSKGKRVYQDQPFPLDFELTVDTRRLNADQRYIEWIEVVLDGMPIRVPLQFQTIARRRTFTLTRRVAWVAGALLAVMLFLLMLPMLGIAAPKFNLPGSLLSANPSYELHPNEMLFAVNEGGQSILYAAPGAGSTPRRLGLVGQHAVGTQAGQRIAYLGDADDTTAIYLFDLASGETKEISQNSAPKSMLAWSPDGLRLAYLVGTGSERRIGVYNSNTDQEYLLPGEAVAGVNHFAWSPDGQTLLFDLGQGAEQRVYRIGLYGNDVRQLTHFDSWAGMWSADGAQILVGTDHGLYLLSSTGQQLRQLTKEPALAASWSADGEWIAYTTAASSPMSTSPMSTSPMSTFPVSSLTDEQAKVPSQIASTAVTPEALWVIKRDGSSRQQITTNLLWQQWSPEGAALGYITGNITSEEPLLYLWTVVPTNAPALVAEVNTPFFAWPR